MGKVLLKSIAIGLSCIVVLSLTGVWFSLGNSAAVVRFPAGVLLALLAPLLFFVGMRRVALLSVLVALVALVPLGLGYFKPNPPCAGTCLTLYQKNLMSRSWPRKPLQEEILSTGADIVTLQEVSEHNLKFMPDLFEAYTFFIRCNVRPEQDAAVLTSLSVVEGTAFCAEGDGLAGVQVISPGGEKIWVLSLHLKWPFPYDQFAQTQRIESHLKKLEGPVILGGDFNMVTWGGSVQRVARATGTKPFGPYRNTHLLGTKFMPLPIDHVLVPEGATGHLERRLRYSSDHVGLFARITLP